MRHATLNKAAAAKYNVAGKIKKIRHKGKMARTTPFPIMPSPARDPLQV